MNRKALYECMDSLKNITDDIEYVLKHTSDEPVVQYSGSEYMELLGRYNTVKRALERTVDEWRKIRTDGDIS